MKRTYPPEFINEAHEVTIFHEKDILASSICTCFYCGYQFDPHKEKDLEWWDETSPRQTLVCPKCGIDCIVGDASGFPVTDTDFIMACTEEWFGGYSESVMGNWLKKFPPYLSKSISKYQLLRATDPKIFKWDWGGNGILRVLRLFEPTILLGLYLMLLVWQFMLF